MYEESATEFRADLQRVHKVAVTTDTWTTTESYVTITCHFIQDWDLNTAVLQTCSTDEWHTAENIADHLRTPVKKLGVLGKVCASVHDNASNIVLANERLLEWESVSCFADMLKIALNDGFKVASVNRLFAYSRPVAHEAMLGRSVSHYKHEQNHC